MDIPRILLILTIIILIIPLCFKIDFKVVISMSVIILLIVLYYSDLLEEYVVFHLQDFTNVSNISTNIVGNTRLLYRALSYFAITHPEYDINIYPGLDLVKLYVEKNTPYCKVLYTTDRRYPNMLVFDNIRINIITPGTDPIIGNTKQEIYIYQILSNSNFIELLSGSMYPSKSVLSHTFENITNDTKTVTALTNILFSFLSYEEFVIISIDDNQPEFVDIEAIKTTVADVLTKYSDVDSINIVLNKIFIDIIAKTKTHNTLLNIQK